MKFKLFYIIIIIKMCYSDKQDTISDALLQCVNTLLQIQMFVAGIVGFVLDNTVPGLCRTKCVLIF